MSPLRLALLLLLLASSARAEERFALVLTGAFGWAQDRPLLHADADAERLRETLVELGGFAADRVELLREPDAATVRARLRRLGEVLRGLETDSLVLLYYVGHADAQGLHLRGSRLAHAELLEALRALPATRKVGLLDTRNPREDPHAPPPSATGPHVRRLHPPDAEDVALLLATDEDAPRPASEWRPRTTGFTYHLLSGLRGAADAEGEARVTLGEACHHAAREVARHRKEAARATCPGLGALESLPLTGWGADAARLSLPAGGRRRYVVVDARLGRAVAQGQTREGGRTELVLPPGAYRVARGRQRPEVATLHLEAGARVEAEGLTYEATTPGALLASQRGLSEAESDALHLGRAVRALASGRVRGLLPKVDALLARHPEDPRVLRLRARTLVRLAELALSEEVLPLLREALVGEPSLVEDPDFAPWRRRLREGEAAEQRAREVRERAHAVREALSNPRAGYLWGVGVDAVGSRGTLALVGTRVLAGAWFPYVALEPLAPAGDVGVRLVPLAWAWSPFVGVGARLPWARLRHGPQAGPPPEDPDWFDPEAPEVVERELRDGHLHLDVGVQYFHAGAPAFACELGAGLRLFQRPSIDSFGLRPSLNAGCGVYF